MIKPKTAKATNTPAEDDLWHAYIGECRDGVFVKVNNTALCGYDGSNIPDALTLTPKGPTCPICEALFRYGGLDLCTK